MENSEKIKNMFNFIAERYDFMNDLISIGTHKIIKSFCIKQIKTIANSKALDLCCGTGDITRLLSHKKCINEVIGVDFSEKMLEIANVKNKNDKIKYLKADCTNLPFENSNFDVCTISFGLRNIENIEKCLYEISRILKSDGIFMHIDFVKSKTIIDKIFDFIIPFFAKIICNDYNSYKYLIDSRQKYYDKIELNELFKKHGLVPLKNYSFMFGTITMQLCKNNNK